MQQFRTRKQIRMPNYDYSMDGWYYVTICARDKENIFGKHNPNIVGADGSRPSNKLSENEIPENGISTNNKIILNEYGLIVGDELHKSEIIRNEIHLDEYVIMPNHIHAIVIIQNNHNDHFNYSNYSVEGRLPSAPTISATYNYKKSLSTFVAAFKAAATKRINMLRGTPQQPVWQRSFHDHVIRNEKSLNNIREYIINNPANWETDEENKDRITNHSSGLKPAV